MLRHIALGHVVLLDCGSPALFRCGSTALLDRRSTALLGYSMLLGCRGAALFHRRSTMLLVCRDTALLICWGAALFRGVGMLGHGGPDFVGVLLVADDRRGGRGDGAASSYWTG